ncbi:META domain-containing protein [Sphingomonas sp. URHD0057]|uniref:META domain-containing protein n=1 Tax=Sphingomonas sp. URHD0057 TaxID=1380389 RepID=UPI00048FEC32|nr:META domain-containing protein [Sphingomonas sp. URHD0057]
MAAAGSRLALLGLVCAGCTNLVFDQRSFEGTQWRITTINVEATDPSSPYPMSFEGGRIHGGFGCNGGSGEYRLAAGQLIVSHVITTERACADLHRQQMEERALHVLRLPMQIGRNPKTGGTILSNGAGSLELAPVVTGRRL